MSVLCHCTTVLLYVPYALNNINIWVVGPSWGFVAWCMRHSPCFSLGPLVPGTAGPLFQPRATMLEPRAPIACTVAFFWYFSCTLKTFDPMCCLFSNFANACTYAFPRGILSESGQVQLADIWWHNQAQNGHFGPFLHVAWPKNDPQQILKRSKEVVYRGHDLHQMPAKWRHLTASRLAKKNKTAAKTDHFGPFWL